MAISAAVCIAGAGSVSLSHFECKFVRHFGEGSSGEAPIAFEGWSGAGLVGAC